MNSPRPAEGKSMSVCEWCNDPRFDADRLCPYCEIPDTLPGAVFSSDRKYRYLLKRTVPQCPMESKGTVGFFLLNGSSAGEVENDRTVTGLWQYTKLWGYGMFLLPNVFGLSATDPEELYKAADPIGPDNDAWIDFVATHSDLLVCGWGNHAEYKDRGRIVGDRLIGMGRRLYCLLGPDGEPLLTKKNQPRHTLYLKASRTPQVFREPATPAAGDKL